jgi:hypothetical protein
MQSSAAISDSHLLLTEAEKDGASKYAKYEYFKAAALLKEAKIKEGYGEFEAARDYAKQARTLAKLARQTAKSRRDLELRRVRGKVLQHKLGRKVLERIQRDRLKQQAMEKAKSPKEPDKQIKTIKQAPVKKKVTRTKKSRGKIKRRKFKPPIMTNPGKSRESR